MLDTQDKQEIEELVELKVKAILKENNYDINIRLVKIEEELKHQRELIQQVIHTMDKRFEEMQHTMDKRFESVDKRFEAMQHTMDKRFGAMQHNMDKRFEDMQHYMDKRFESVDKRFNQLTWVMGTGFVVLGTMISAFGLFLSLAGP